MKKKLWLRLTIWLLVGAFSCLVMLSALYVLYIGVDNVKTVYALQTGDKEIVAMDEEGIYLTRMEGSVDRLIELMEREGWSYKGQEGSGYFFENGEEQAIVSVTIWRRGFVEYSVHPKQLSLIN